MIHVSIACLYSMTPVTKSNGHLTYTKTAGQAESSVYFPRGNGKALRG